MSGMINSRARSSIRVLVDEPAVVVPVPSYFQCPISLELMNDPVTLSTGHTYDRSSIERWFRAGNNTCPQTRMEVSTRDLIPNLTLKNCIRSWQKNHNMWTVVPRRELDLTTSLTEEDVRLMLEDIRSSYTLENLRTLRVSAKSSFRDRKLICDGGAVPVLVSILSRDINSTSSSCRRIPNCFSSPSSCSELGEKKFSESSQLIHEEALGALVDLCVRGEIKLLPEFGPANLLALAWFLRKGSSEAKFLAVRIIESLILEDDDCLVLQLGMTDGMIPGLIGVIREHRTLPRALRPSLRCLYSICLPKKNRSTASKAGAVASVIELLATATRDIAEVALAFLHLMSKCSEGRSALHRHALCIPIMIKSISAYSSSATEHAVRVLHSLLTKHVVYPLMYEEAIKKGLIPRLLMIYQVPNISSNTRQKTGELLKNLLLHSNSSERCDRTMRYSR